MKKVNEEEFENFMHRVTEINGIVKQLSSPDVGVQGMALARADRYLKEPPCGSFSADMDETTVELTVKDNRSVINFKKGGEQEEKDPATMSQEAFMREIERDANKRHRDRMVRKEKSDTVKTQANKAFRRGEYERALALYNKAIGFTKDSCVLYTNRALTHILLGFPDKALADCDTALRVNGDSLKAWLYKSRCHYAVGDEQRRLECVNEALGRHPDERDRIHEFIDGYLRDQ